MKLVESLLEAISRLEGDALIMHVGEKPYVVTTSASMYAYRGPLAWGHVELSSRVLTTDAVVGMLEQLLPADQRQALDEYGAIEYAVPSHAPGEDRFTVVAARGGEDVWLEIRRTPAALGVVGVPEAVPVQVPQPIAAEAEGVPAPERAVDVPQPVAAAPQPLAEVARPVASGSAADVKPAVADVIPPVADVPQPAALAEEAEPAPFEIVEDEPQIVPTHAEVDALLSSAARALVPEASKPMGIEEPEAVPELVKAQEPVTAAEPVKAAEPAKAEEPAKVEEPVRAEEPVKAEEPARVEEPGRPAEPTAAQPPDPAPQPVARPKVTEEPRPAIVLPLSRSPIAAEPPAEIRTTSGSPLERVLRIAAARGAATVYVVAQSKPVIRVDGEISVLEGEPALTAAEVERLVMDLAPARGRDITAPGEWMADVPDVGRIRCVTFRDHRGPGVIFRMIPPKAISADQLGIAPEVQALCAQADGLVLVTGARASGKSTLLSAFVDLINRTRSDHVITIESQIGFVHESRRSFISQREVRGDSDAAAGAVRSAFREDPDVLVIEDMRTPEIVSAALEGAESGRLVFGSVSAPSTTAALDRLIEMFPLDRRAQAQTSLAGALRGVVAQTLLRKVRGGRIAAREILLNTPAVSSLILEGKTFQLPVALDSGRRHGMMPLADSLAALVREGIVHAAEAYRKAPDREALLAALRRDGVDTSFAERLA